MDTYLVPDPRQYDFQSAAWIAQEHATGETLLALHAAHPDAVPAPMIIKRWRREFPAFDLLMVEAEHARADVLVDQTLDIADSDKRTAGAARNSIQARQWAAAKLDQDRYGQKKHVDTKITHEGTVKHESMSVYSDEDLQAIIRAGMRESALDGESKRIDQATPAPPPGSIPPGLEQNDESDPSTAKIFHTKQPVTTNNVILKPLPDKLTSDPLAKDAPQPGKQHEPVYYKDEVSDEAEPPAMGPSMARLLGVKDEAGPRVDEPEF